MDIVNPEDSLERRNEKLHEIVNALMYRAEQSSEQSGYSYAQFERAALLEAQVRERTADLERILELLNESNRRLAEANDETEAAWSNLKEATDTIPDGLALFDGDDRLLLFNRQFCNELPDVGVQLRVGLTFRDYLELASKSKYLDLSAFDSRTHWIAWRLQMHGRHRVEFNLLCTNAGMMRIQSRKTSTGSTVVLHSDVTGAVRHERARLNELQVIQLRTTLDHLDLGVCIFGSSGRLMGRNSRSQSLLALSDDELPQGLTALALIERLRSQVEFTETFSFDELQRWVEQPADREPVEFVVKRGERMLLSVLCQEMADHGFLISFRDVTTEREAGRTMAEMNEMLERRVKERTIELHQALGEAKRANASKSRFVAAASHDLAQPLSAAKLYIASLADDGGAKHVADVAQKAETALHSAEQIIEALLDISRFDSKAARFDRQPVPLNLVLTALENEMVQQARAKGLDFVVVPSSLVVNSDPGYLRRIIRNFISNAVRYTDQGKVLVGVRRVNGIARIEVWDTGRGIGTQEQGIIFEEFRQLDQGAGETEGLGLGLAIVERACKALGHPLNLWSQQEVGSCFSIDLPIVSTSVLQPEPDSPPAPERPTTDAITGLIVLLVVTDVQLSSALSNLIEGWGGIALEVASRSEALSLLGDVDLVPDILILDGHLNDGMTGVNAYDAITGLLGGLPTRIITADRSDDLRRLCQERELEIMYKPIDPVALGRFLTSVGTARRR